MFLKFLFCTRYKYIFGLVIVLFLASCGSNPEMAAQAPTQEASATIHPTSTTVPPTSTSTPVPPTPTVTKTPLPTETATATATPTLEMVSQELHDQIMAIIPVMWTYDRASKTFVERTDTNYQFYFLDRVSLIITDENGNEVGFVKNFFKDRLNSPTTAYYSLTDGSTRTLFPIRFFSQMGEYETSQLVRKASGGPSYTEWVLPHLFAFSENFYTSEPPWTVNQTTIDRTNEFAADILEIADGEEMIQMALVKTFARIKGVTVEQILQDLQNGIPVEIDIDGEVWDLGKGVDFVWRDSGVAYSHKIENGRLLSFNSQFSEGTWSFPDGWVYSLAVMLNDNFGKDIKDIAAFFYVNTTPALSTTTIRSPTVFTVIPDDH